MVLNKLNITVKKGSFFALLGANGAGKSTSIECILGTKKYDMGSVKILGLVPLNDRKTLFQKVGVQFQEGDYQLEIRVDEICQEYSCLYKSPSNYIDLCNLFGIGEKLKQPVKNLCSGERQKLFIVLSLISNPEVVFLDELTTGLDPKARRDVWKILKYLKIKGLTVLLTSHFMDEVESLCDEICILKEGNTVFYGSVAEAIEITNSNKFEDAYLILSGEEKVE